MRNIPRWTPVALAFVLITQYLYGNAQGGTDKLNLMQTVTFVFYAVVAVVLVVLLFIQLKSLKTKDLGWPKLVLLLLGLALTLAFGYSVWQSLSGGNAAWLVGPFSVLRATVSDVSPAWPFAAPYLLIIAATAFQMLRGRRPRTSGRRRASAVEAQPMSAVFGE